MRVDYKNQSQYYIDRMQDINAKRYNLRKAQLKMLQALEIQRREIIDASESDDRELISQYHEIELELGVVRDAFAASLRQGLKNEEGGDK